MTGPTIFRGHVSMLAQGGREGKSDPFSNQAFEGLIEALRARFNCSPGLRLPPCQPLQEMKLHRFRHIKHRFTDNQTPLTSTQMKI